MPRPKRHIPPHADGRPLNITFGEMRGMGVRGVRVYCPLAAVTLLSMPTAGRTRCGCLILSRNSSVRDAAAAAPMCGLISSAATHGLRSRV